MKRIAESIKELRPYLIECRDSYEAEATRALRADEFHACGWNQGAAAICQLWLDKLDLDEKREK